MWILLPTACLSECGWDGQAGSNEWQLVCVHDVKKMLSSLIAKCEAQPQRAVYDMRASLPAITANRAAQLIAQAGGQAGATNVTAAAATAKSAGALDLCTAGIVSNWTGAEQLISDLVLHSKEARRVLQAHTCRKPPTVTGPRGGMVELFGTGIARVYEITVAPGYVRGGHYHKIQTGAPPCE